MNRKLLFGIASICALGLPLAGFAADGYGVNAPPSATGERTESTITGKVKAKLAMEQDVSAMNITVTTDDKGVVTLSGTARTQDEADKAISLAQSVDGVTAVQNNIQVSP